MTINTRTTKRSWPTLQVLVPSLLTGYLFFVASCAQSFESSTSLPPKTQDTGTLSQNTKDTETPSIDTTDTVVLSEEIVLLLHKDLKDNDITGPSKQISWSAIAPIRMNDIEIITVNIFDSELQTNTVWLYQFSNGALRSIENFLSAQVIDTALLDINLDGHDDVVFQISEPSMRDERDVVVHSVPLIYEPMKRIFCISTVATTWVNIKMPTASVRKSHTFNKGDCGLAPI